VASPNPSPALTDAAGRELTEAEAQAFREATDVVVAYRQTIVDLYSGARTDLNDLYKVATGDLLDQNLRNIQRGLREGRRAEPQGASALLVTVRPLEVELSRPIPRMTVEACIDLTAVTDVNAQGRRSDGVREALEYQLVQTDYLPAPGWAVRSVMGDPDAEDRKC
jgi:hypothetical protein